MKITLNYLKILWDKDRLNKIKNIGFFIGSTRLFKNKEILPIVDAVWSEKHDYAIKERNKTPGAKHIFISQICDVAVGEYATVCKLCKVKRIVIISDAYDNSFFLKSEKLLKTINVPVLRMFKI